MGLKESILGANDSPVTPFQAAEWGSPPLFLRTLSGLEKDRFDVSRLPAKDGAAPQLQNISARFAVLVLGDQSGLRIFTDDDAALLGMKSSQVLDRVWNEGRKFNGMDRDGVTDAKKDSAAIPGDATSGGSPSPAA